MSLNFRGWCSGGNPMTSVGAYKFCTDFVKPQTEARQTLAQDLVGCTGFLVRVRPGVHQRSQGLVAGRIADRNLVVICRGTAFDSGETNTIRSRLLEPYSGEIGDAVRRDVLRRVSDFVQQLLFDGR